MSRITHALSTAKARSGGFVPFVTCGDPDLKTTLEIMLTLAASGADVLEIGVPFSDPMADGPTIQRSSQRALLNGVSIADVLDLSAEFTRQSTVPIVLFSYINPILRFGLDEFAQAASDAGIAGLLITDAVDDEAATISRGLSDKNIDLISLVAPTTTDERLEQICARARGFIYAVSRAGVTGARAESSSAAEDLVRRTRKFTNLPIAVGFGISNAAQVSEVWRYADAAVIGSAIVAEIERAETPIDAVDRVKKFVRALDLPVANEVFGT